MARKSKGGGITVTTEDMAFAVLGAIGGLAVNGLANKALETQSEGVKNTFGKALPVLKIVGGAFAPQNKKMDRRVRFAGLGLAATGGIELGIKMAPQYFSIAGTGGSDVFALIGNSNVVNIPITPSSSAGASDDMFEEELAGVAGDESGYMVL